MKIALLIRGFHFLDKDRFGYPLDARPLLPSLLEQVLEPLRREHAVKVFAVTYASPIVNDVESIIRPDRLVVLDPKGSGQLATYRRALREIQSDAEAPFDRMITTRFDLVYLKSVLAWDVWTRRGIFFPWRETESLWNWDRRVGDAVHVIDEPWIAAFDQGIAALEGRPSLHELYRALDGRDLPLQFVETGFYDSNSLFSNPECENPIYRIGNRPKLDCSGAVYPLRIRKYRRMMPYFVWRFLASPRERWANVPTQGRR